MPIFDYKCDECGEVIEKLTSQIMQSTICTCGGIMWKQFSIPNVYLDGTDPSFPGAYAKWGRSRVKQAEQHKKKSYYEP